MAFSAQQETTLVWMNTVIDALGNDECSVAFNAAKTVLRKGMWVQPRPISLRSVTNVAAHPLSTVLWLVQKVIHTPSYLWTLRYGCHCSNPLMHKVAKMVT